MAQDLSTMLRLVVALVALPQLVFADVKSADEKMLRGDYPGAIKDYKAVKGKDGPRATVRLGRILLRTGDYAGAERAARASAKASDKAVALDAAVLLAETQRAVGKLADARGTLEDVLKREPRHLRARYQLVLVYDETGQTELAGKLIDKFYDDWDQKLIDEKNAEQLMYVALSARQRGDVDAFKDANDFLRDAVDNDGKLLEANVEWGFMLIEKYAVGEAETAFDDVLKIDPNHPDAHAGMARVKLEQNYDFRGALEQIEKTLSLHPAHPVALAIRAEMEIDNQEYASARKTLARILAVNPAHPHALALLAATHWLTDDRAGYQQLEKKVLAQNPKFGRFYHIVADFAVKEHRYQEAIKLEEQALKVDPEYHDALQAIGTNYLRMGEEKKGLEYLNKAWPKDRFNQRTYNTLNLYDVIDKEYESVSSKSFKFRVPKGERKIIERYVPRTLERAYADMVKRYGFTPRQPTTIEMYADPQQYSVRTVGLPNLAALGVCFGNVVTALSPSNGNLNWGMILWHELGHVFAIQITNSRVPRWFTEGLSEYETAIVRKEWRRENDVDIWMAMQAGALPSVAALNTMFTRAQDLQEMVVAYHLSSVAVEFIATRWGFPKIVEALKLFGKGKDTTQVLKAITGLEIAVFDAEFRKYLDKRLAPYKGTFRIRMQAYQDVSALEKAAAATPDDAEAQAALALGYVIADDLDRAAKAAAKALAKDPKHKKALWAQFEIAFRNRDVAGAKGKLRALIAAGGDGYDARLRLGVIAKEENDAATAERELNAAKKLDPERSEPYQVLAEMYFKANREVDALKELERYAYLEQMEYGPVKKLTDKYFARQDFAKTREFGEMALYINPYDAELHITMGEAYLALSQAKEAAYEFESALLVDPPARRPAVAHVGAARAWLALKDTARARKELARALELEPKNQQALALKKKVK
jgi:cellulose synthase operon protein C